MTCIKINNGIICSGTLSIQEISLSDGTKLWFEDHKNFGPFFWLDEDCTNEYENWWDNEELSKFVDIFYPAKTATLNDL